VLTPAPPVSGAAGQRQWVATQGQSIYAIDYGRTSDVIYRYQFRNDGTVTGPTSSVNTQNYGGSVCGYATSDAVIDPTGKYLSLDLSSSQSNGAGGLYSPCATWQTYRLQADGSFEFQGDYQDNDGADHFGVQLWLTAVSGNGQFAYGTGDDSDGSWFNALSRDSTGTLMPNRNFTVIGPVTDPTAQTDDRYFPWGVAADSSNHLAVIVRQEFAPDPNTKWLAIYTIDPTTGAIQSTNTYANMPQVAEDAFALGFSPTGLLAVPSFGQVQLFHVNGTDPATPQDVVTVPNLVVSGIAWDNSNHLYLLTQTNSTHPSDDTQFSLYVYTVTNSGVTQVPGSPWNVPNAVKIVVVPES
jgi:hypothetical protein